MKTIRGDWQKTITLYAVYTQYVGKVFFGIDKTSSLIERLTCDPNLRLLCGFAKVPGKARFFSRASTYLPSTTISSDTLDALRWLQRFTNTSLCAMYAGIRRRYKLGSMYRRKRLLRRGAVITRQTEESLEASLAQLPTRCSYGELETSSPVLARV